MRLRYCSLLISLQEEDVRGVTAALKALGYVNNQSERAPERDQEFFEFMFRDANVSIRIIQRLVCLALLESSTIPYL